MSCNYADGLSPYENKGVLGVDEKFDSKEEVAEKVATLAAWIQESNHVVIHTGAGISTSAGIPDFRGPKGVWTLEAKGEKPDMNISFNDAVPTKTHMALAKLVQVGKVQYIVSQNIDGLHLRSGVPRRNLAELHGNMFVFMNCYDALNFVSGKVQYIVSQNIDGLHLRSGVPRRNLAELHGNMFVFMNCYDALNFVSGKVQYIVSQNIDGLHLRSGVPRRNLAELHGNMFVEQCAQCNRQFVRSCATSSVGQKCLLKPCPTSRLNGRPCRGRMHDTILDWEANLPENDLGMADFHSCVADLCICLGTTLQIVPSGNLPLHTKKYNNGRLVICNLQPTKHDRKADLLIHTYVDDILTQLMEKLGLTIPEYSRPDDPTMARRMVEWTILDSEVQTMRRLYEKTCCKGKKKKSDKEKFSNFKKLKREPGIDDVQCNMKDVKDIKTEIKVEIEVNGITTTG
ncbi:LOW QUALITY PROTEIN: NAD-dependent protein deacetylase Sirt6-like [Homalodisca vitripennis]|uniref:LOW QUALITY PROTEIN: NAD-dependent protein deacetylase Sirt6-like n=1 Tax=Homalodisca vitripennis TaxID=197043 RepID=UPI001EEC5093|nr:LOW QUALITY PROTEIN: NAD-dependent protein deacetylase Sirt6-like [Homalodisca vitripennis]